MLLVPYSGRKRVSPKAVALDAEQLVSSNEEKIVREMQDLLWLISRAAAEDTLFPSLKEKQLILSWTAFFVKINEAETPRESVIGYSQVLDHSSTELSIVYTSFKRSITMAGQIGQTDVVIVCDLADYAKAAEIINKKKNELGRIVLRLGAFHLACLFLGIIGKSFRNAGLEDILIESDVIAAGSVNGELEGKHYNRGIRMHKLVMEALFPIKWKKFGQ